MKPPSIVVTKRGTERRRGTVPRTSQRSYFGQDHMPPQGRRLGRKADQQGEFRKRGNREIFNGDWPGTGKEHEKARRKRRNRKTWQKQIAATWRADLAARRNAT